VEQALIYIKSCRANRRKLRVIFQQFSKEHVMYKRLLVATDGSTLSKKAVTSGVNLAQALGAELVLMKVVPRYTQTYFEGVVTLGADDVKKIEKEWVNSAQAVLDKALKASAGKVLSTKTVVVKADRVAEAIISTAKKQDCDLIVMASHGRSGISRVLLGSETNAVLTHSHVPVLVLR
jgi:nucleotide-binding universal stress UspA family protein